MLFTEIHTDSPEFLEIALWDPESEARATVQYTAEEVWNLAEAMHAWLRRRSV